MYVPPSSTPRRIRIIAGWDGLTLASRKKNTPTIPKKGWSVFFFVFSFRKAIAFSHNEKYNLEMEPSSYPCWRAKRMCQGGSLLDLTVLLAGVQWLVAITRTIRTARQGQTFIFVVGSDFNQQRCN